MREIFAAYRARVLSTLALLRPVPRRRWKTAYGVHDRPGRQTVADLVIWRRRTT